MTYSDEAMKAVIQVLPEAAQLHDKNPDIYATTLDYGQILRIAQAGYDLAKAEMAGK